MAIDIRELEKPRLVQMIQNYERLKATSRPEYQQLVEEYNRRHGGNFELAKSIAFIKEHARQRRCVSYGALATLHGAEWSSVRYQMPEHLWALVKWAASNGAPLLSAVVVNKQNVESGELEASSLKGFIRAAEALGYKVDDPLEFHRRQRDLCFAWAAASTAEKI